MDGPPPQRWDRSKWITVFSSHSPTIREVTECLGLGLSPSASTTNRGIPKFDAPDFKKLSSEVTRLSKELPQDRDALLDFAADPRALEKELDDLLLTLGPAIWGKDADRSRLVKPDPEKKTYYKDLVYDDPEDRDVLKIHLQRWIVIKACYYIRNRKLKKHSMGEEFDTVADIDAGSPATAHKPDLVVKHLVPSPQLRNILSPPQSPNATPHSGTPPVERSATPTYLHGNIRKRKSSAFQSYSDDEDASSHGSGLGPRKRSYASLPIQRKSPRKSLPTSRQSSENIPPSPSLSHLQQLASAAPTTTPTQDVGRLLSPLSSSALNGAARPPSNAANSFAAVNAPASNPSTGSFAAVNTSNAPTAPSSHTFAAVNAPAHSSGSAPPITLAHVNAPTSAPSATPNAFAAVNASHTSASSSPKLLAPAPAGGSDATTAPSAYASANSPANAPAAVAGGFTAVNASPPASGSAAQNSRGYSSPYSGSAHGAPDTRTNGHGEVLPHHPAPVQREPSPQKSHPPHPTEPQSAHSHAPNVMQTTTPPTLAPNTQHGAQYTFQAHNGSTGRERSTFQPNVHPQPAPNGGAYVQAPTLPSNAPTRPPVNGHTAPPQAVSRVINPTEMVLLQCDLLGLMMKFFFPRDGPRLEDAILLQNIDYIWQHNEYQFRQTMGHLYDMQTKILYAWMEERRKISQLQYSMESHPGLKASEMVDRLLAMNDLRVMRLKWKSLKTQVGSETLAPEDLLCKTFVTMTKTEGTEKLFKQGLELLNDSVFEFLRSEDMTISISKR